MEWRLSCLPRRNTQYVARKKACFHIERTLVAVLLDDLLVLNLGTQYEHILLEFASGDKSS